MADGTFSANKSLTAPIDGDRLRAMLLDDDDRAALFGDEPNELRSKPTSKAIRLGIGPGVAEIAIIPASDDRTKVTVQHNRLPTFDDVEQWKFFWADWLEALREADQA